MRTASTVTKIVGVVTLVFFGYVILSGLPDVGRYIKISRM
jgi:hypothetical protein